MSLRELIEQMQSAKRGSRHRPNDPVGLGKVTGTPKREGVQKKEDIEAYHIPESWIVGVHVMERGDD